MARCGIVLCLSSVFDACGMESRRLNLPRFPPFPESMAIFRPKLAHPDNIAMDSLSFVVFEKTKAWQKIWSSNNKQNTHHVLRHRQNFFLQDIMSSLVDRKDWEFVDRMELIGNEEAQRRAEMLTSSDGIKQLLEESETDDPSVSDLRNIDIEPPQRRGLGLPAAVRTLSLKQFWILSMRNFTCPRLDLSVDFDACGNEVTPSQKASCELISDEEIVNMISHMMVRKWSSRDAYSGKEFPSGQEMLTSVHVFKSCAGAGESYEYVSMAVHNIEEHLYDRDILRGDSSIPCAHGLCASASDFMVDQGVHVEAQHERVFSPNEVKDHFGVDVEDDITLWEQHHRFTERFWANNFIKWKDGQSLPKRLAILVHCAAKLAFADEGRDSPADNGFFSVQPDRFDHMRRALAVSDAVVGLDRKQVWSVPHMFHCKAQRSFDDYCRERLEVKQVIPKSKWHKD